MLNMHSILYAGGVILEILILAVLIYLITLFLRGTRSAPILFGLVTVIITLYALALLLRLEVVEWLLNRMVAAAALGVVIIFQPELRRVFAEIGSTQSRLRNTSRERQQRITTIIDSVVFLASHRVGALIAVERDIGMRGIAETGTPIRAPLTQQLLTTFFFPDTPLHDGGVLIKGGMILAAGCIFPLTDDPDFARSLGTRHRAAVGLSEETDAIVLVVSEESGAISLAFKGRLVRGLNRQRLERHLRTHLVRNPPRSENRLGGRFQSMADEAKEESQAATQASITEPEASES